jgi:hypothetical protein
VLLLWGLTRLPVFQIKTVAVEGSDNVELQKDFQGLIGTSVFSRELSRTVERWLLKDRSLSGLECRRGLPDSISCEAVLRAPSLVWLRDGKEFLVDDDGALYAEKGPQALSLPVVEDRLAEAVQIGNAVASAEVVEQLTRLHRLLGDRGITVSKFFITDSLYQIGAVLTSWQDSSGAVVNKELTALFVSTQPLEAQTKALRALLRERGSQINERVDLRVPGYLYYK